MNSYNLYLVVVKCGHVGRYKYISKVLPIKAKDGKEAALKARNTPRVKHNLKNAIEQIEKVTKKEFFAQLAKNNQDNYFKCENKRQQKELCPEIDLEVRTLKLQDKKRNRIETLEYRRKKKDLKDKEIKKIRDESYKEIKHTFE